MSDQSQQPEATEAAQHVVDEVTSYEYSADDARISEKLESGLAEAGVTVDDAEKDRLTDAIHDLRTDESAGTPRVTSAQPEE